MTIQRVCGLSILLAAITLSGCSSLKGKSETQKPDSGTTTISDSGADAGKGIVINTDSNDSRLGAGSSMAKAAQAGLGAEQSVVHFAYDSDSLSPSDLGLLKKHAAFLKANLDVLARLEGHTDERGTPEYNMALGERRAKAVWHFLRANGVKTRQLEVLSYGEIKPLVSGEDEGSWAQNRRVEMVYH